MIVTGDILATKLFEVIANLTSEEKAEWREALIAWAEKKELTNGRLGGVEL